MINNTNPEGGEAPKKPDLKVIAEAQIPNGVSIGIERFLVKNNVNLHPTSKCKKPLGKFLDLLMAEYSKRPERFPFKASLKSLVVQYTAEEHKNLVDLHDNNEIDAVNGLSRMIGCAAVLDFLEQNREEVLRKIREIRADLPNMK